MPRVINSSKWLERALGTVLLPQKSIYLCTEHQHKQNKFEMLTEALKGGLSQSFLFGQNRSQLTAAQLETFIKTTKRPLQKYTGSSQGTRNSGLGMGLANKLIGSKAEELLSPSWGHTFSYFFFPSLTSPLLLQMDFSVYSSAWMQLKMAASSQF